MGCRRTEKVEVKALTPPSCYPRDGPRIRVSRRRVMERVLRHAVNLTKTKKLTIMLVLRAEALMQNLFGGDRSIEQSL